MIFKKQSTHVMFPKLVIIIFSVMIFSILGVAKNEQATCSTETASWSLASPSSLGETPGKRVPIDELEKQLVAAYLGIIDDSESILIKASIREAIENEDPFALRGRGGKWTLTLEALNELSSVIDLRSRSQQRLREALLKSLREKEGKSKKNTTRKKEAVQKANDAPLMSIVKTLPKALNGVVGVKFSPEGDSIITVNEYGALSVYDYGDKLRLRFANKPLGSDSKYEVNRWGHYSAGWPLARFAFSPNPEHFAMVLSHVHEATLKVYDGKSGKVYRDIRNASSFTSGPLHNSGTRSLLFSQNGHYLAAAGGPGSYSCGAEIWWNLDANQAPIRNHPRFGAGNGGAFSPDEKFYFSASSGGSGRAYYLPDGSELLTFPGKDGEHDRDTRWRSLFGGNDIIHNPLKQNELIVFHSGYWGGGYSLATMNYSKLEAELSGEGTFLSSDGGRNIHYVNKNPLRQRTFYQEKANEEHQDEGGMLITPDNKYLIVQVKAKQHGPDGTPLIDVFDLKKLGKPVARLGKKHPDFMVRKFEFSSDGKYMLTLAGNTLRIFKYPSFQEVASYGGNENPVYDFSLSVDMKWIAVVEEDSISVNLRNFSIGE